MVRCEGKPVCESVADEKANSTKKGRLDRKKQTVTRSPRKAPTNADAGKPPAKCSSRVVVVLTSSLSADLLKSKQTCEANYERALLGLGSSSRARTEGRGTG